MLIKYILKLVKMVNFVLGIFCHSIKGGMVLGWFRCRQRTAGTNVGRESMDERKASRAGLSRFGGCFMA